MMYQGVNVEGLEAYTPSTPLASYTGIGLTVRMASMN